MSAYVDQIAVLIATWVRDTEHPVFEVDLMAALKGRATEAQVHGAARVAVERGWLTWAPRENGQRVLDAAEGMR